MNLSLNVDPYVHKAEDKKIEAENDILDPNFKIRYPIGWTIEKNNPVALSRGAVISFFNNKYDYSIFGKVKSNIMITYGDKEFPHINEVLEQTINSGVYNMPSFKVVSSTIIPSSETTDGLESAVLCFTHRYIRYKLRVWSLFKVDDKWQYAVVATASDRKWKKYDSVIKECLGSFEVI